MKLINELKFFWNSTTTEHRQLRANAFRIIGLFSFLLSAALLWNLWSENNKLNYIAENIARSNFLKDQTFRFWATQHGGVYVPVTVKTQPNPFLKHIPHRDIYTPDSTKLTLMNPAYMLRQMMDEYPGHYGARGRITSLKYFHEGNKPDKWEEKALKSFENGAMQAFEYTEVNDEPFLRFMKPMYTKNDCLKCHYTQGYKEGDVRGGVGVMLPLTSLYKITEDQAVIITLVYFLLWVMLVVLIVFFILREFRRLNEQILIQDKLVRNEEHLRITLNSIGDAVISTDTEGRITSMNTVAQDLTAWTFNEAKGKPLTDIFNIINAKTKEKTIDPVQKVLQTGNIIELANHTMLISKEGKTYQISDTAAPIKNMDGKIIGVVLVFRDVSEEYRIKNELQQNEQRLRTLIDVVPSMIYAKNKDGKFLVANKATAENFQTNIDDLIGKSANDIEIFKHNYQKIIDNDNQVFSQHSPVIDNCSFEVKGNKKWFNIIKVRCSTQDFGEPAFVGCAIDITNLKKSEESLRSSEEQFRHLMEQSPLPIQIFDSNGYLVKTNKAWKELWKVTNSEKLLGKFNIISNPIFATVDLFQELRSTFNGQQVDMPNIIFNPQNFGLTGRTRHVNIKAYPLTNDQGNVQSVVVFNEDITEKKKSEEELQKISKLESLGILAGGIAHNFKNMLTSMSLSVELAQLKPDKVHYFLSKIIKSVNQASALATKFQTYSKGGTPILKPTKINRIISDAVEVALSGSSASVRYDLEKDIPDILADDKQMNEVLTNLLMNADQAMPQGGNIYLRTKTATMKDQSFVLVEIQDEGIGIPQKDLNEIFTPFFTSKENGHGLGLSSVYYIIEKHFGKITVESTENKGSIFKLFLPISQENMNEILPDSEYLEFEIPLKILVLDDDKDIVENLVEIGESLNIQLICFKNPNDAIANYQQTYVDDPYDLVILDMTLKGFNKDGLAVLREMKAINPDIKALVFSGHSQKSVVANYREYGFAGRLEKPFLINQFIAEIKKALKQTNNKLN